uniref:Neural cell adhesion molecule L1.1 n=1 Tax=Mola mola TaxID=94237 RepID=A0A3Q3W986_MOLML
FTPPDPPSVTGLSQPPVLTKMPTSFTAFSPEDVFLPCEASGSPPPTYVHPHVPTQPSSYDEPLKLYEGHYRCYASNALGTAVTRSARVIVEAQPVLLKQQKVLKSALEGDSIVLSCSPPESSTPPYIHWMDKKMVHIRQSDRVMVGLDGSLYFANLLKSDSRDDYICNAQYTAARTILPEAAVTLRVTPSNDVSRGRKPHFFRHSGPHSSVLALRGHSITLECLPRGLPTPRLDWKKKDGSLEETGGRPENHDRWLHFGSIALEDDGEYDSSLLVLAAAAPYWVKEPVSQLFAPGETVRLQCQAEGIPTPTVTWSVNGQPITDLDDDPRRSVSAGVLILRDVEFSDTAVFQCEATNKHGSVLLNTYLYVIELPPQILSSDGRLYRVTEGRTVMMGCDSFGSPRPHVTWEGEDRLPLLSDSRVSLMTNGTLVLSDVNHNDAGVYTCSMTHSNVSISAHLEVFNQTRILTPPQDLEAVRGSNILLDCLFSVDPQLPGGQIVWKKDGQKLQPSEPPNKFSFFENGTLKVADVQSKDSARYSCEVIAALDHVSASGSVTVVDWPDPPERPSLSDVTDHSLTLSWVPGQSHNSPVTGTEPPRRLRSAGNLPQTRVAERLRRLSLPLCSPFCTYRFRVITVNKLGRSEPSEASEHHSTPPAAPDRNPTGVRSESTEPQTLVVTWDEMDKRFHNGQDFQYKVWWREAGGTDARWNSTHVRSPPFTVHNTGTYTPFEIKVQAVNSLGAGPAPQPEIGHSGEQKPAEAPTGVRTTVINSTVQVQWNAAQNVRGLLLGYKVPLPRWERGRERGERRVMVVHGMKTSEEVMGLRLHSRYELSVSAFNSKGEGPHSPLHHFSTPEGAPGPPASLRFDSPSETSLVLHWTPPAETNGILRGYVVQYQQGEVKPAMSVTHLKMISDPGVTHIELDHLDPSSHYVFKVIAYTAAGEGPPITCRGATLLEGVPPSNVTIVPGNTVFNLSWEPGERDRNHGFHIQYSQLKNSFEGLWEESEVVNSTQGFYSLTGLLPGTHYRLRILHENNTHWEKVIQTVGPVPAEVLGGFATQGWLIGLISAIVLLILILLILCLIKRSKGGKYKAPELTSDVFPRSDRDEKRSDSQPSLCGDSKLGSDDSLAEYGDSVDIQFNEDGSAIAFSQQKDQTKSAVSGESCSIIGRMHRDAPKFGH